MSTQQDARETAIVDALDWIKRGASGLEPEAFYRAVDDPAVVHAASTEGAARSWRRNGGAWTPVDGAILVTAIGYEAE